MKWKEAGKKERRRYSLTEIFTVVISAIILIVSVLIILIFVQVYRNAVEQNAVTGSEQAVSQVKKMVQKHLNGMEDIMKNICNKLKRDREQGEKMIQNMVDIYPGIISISIYDDQGKLLRLWEEDGIKPKDKIYRDLSYEVLERPNKIYVGEPHVDTRFSGFYPWVVTVSSKIRMSDGKDVQVAMNISFSDLIKYVDDVGIGAHGYCYIANKKGGIIYHPQEILSTKKVLENPVKKEGVVIRKNVVYTASDLDSHDWQIVGVCYVNEMIQGRLSMIAQLLIIIGVTVIGSAIVLWVLVSRLHTGPLKKLSLSMKEFEEDTKNYTYVQSEGTKEVASLSTSFAHMVLQIQGLMEQVRREEIILRKTELKALQAQINPHFLYNTLDAIAWLCEGGKNKDAAGMVHDLASLFRISISRGHEMIPIEKEIQHAKSYLNIQKYRYKDQFEYRFEVDESCLAYYCNKITLQPMIENAIYHGLNRMVDRGEIIIRIIDEKAEESEGLQSSDGKSDILLQVIDNGVGMSKDLCREILEDESGEKAGIGIKNVDNRIKIYFGNAYGVSIESEEDEGTTVSIRIPKIREEDVNEK